MSHYTILAYFEPPLGIEPSYHDYKSCASPAMLWGLIVEDTGIEPVTLCM